MLEPDEILEEILSFMVPDCLRGKKVLITAGPTFEAIDAVRGITNLSSGRMGYAGHPVMSAPGLVFFDQRVG